MSYGLKKDENIENKEILQNLATSMGIRYAKIEHSKLEVYTNAFKNIFTICVLWKRYMQREKKASSTISFPLWFFDLFRDNDGILNKKINLSLWDLLPVVAIFSVLWPSFFLESKEFIKQLTIAIKNCPEEELKKEIKKFLKNHPKWAIVFDNIDLKEDFQYYENWMNDICPNSNKGGHIFILTRQPDIAKSGGVKPTLTYQIEPLELVHALELLNTTKENINNKSDYNEKEEEDFKDKIVKHLSRLPLAIVCAGRYMQTFHESSKSYHDLLKSVDLSKILNEKPTNYDRQKGAYDVLYLSLKHVHNIRPSAIKTLKVLSILSEETLFGMLADILCDPSNNNLEQQINMREDLRTLREYSIVQINGLGENRRINIHNLQKELVKNYSSDAGWLNYIATWFDWLGLTTCASEEKKQEQIIERIIEVLTNQYIKTSEKNNSLENDTHFLSVWNHAKKYDKLIGKMLPRLLKLRYFYPKEEEWHKFLVDIEESFNNISNDNLKKTLRIEDINDIYDQIISYYLKHKNLKDIENLKKYYLKQFKICSIYNKCYKPKTLLNNESENILLELYAKLKVGVDNNENLNKETYDLLSHVCNNLVKFQEPNSFRRSLFFNEALSYSKKSNFPENTILSIP